MIIAGLTGSGKDTLIHSILRECILSNEVGKFTYVYIDTVHRTFSPFGKCNRITAYSELMSQLNTDDYLTSVRQFLQRLVLLKDCTIEKETLVVVINNYDAMSDYITMLVEYCVSTFKDCDTVKFIISVQGNAAPNNSSDFRYKLLTRTTEGVSNKLIHCNLASSCADKYGTCWFFDEKTPDVYSKLEVEFTPDWSNNRLLKSLNLSKPTGMCVVETMNNIKNNMPQKAIDNRIQQELTIKFSDYRATKARLAQMIAEEGSN